VGNKLSKLGSEKKYNDDNHHWTTLLLQLYAFELRDTYTRPSVTRVGPLSVLRIFKGTSNVQFIIVIPGYSPLVECKKAGILKSIKKHFNCTRVQILVANGGSRFDDLFFDRLNFHILNTHGLRQCIRALYSLESISPFMEWYSSNFSESFRCGLRLYHDLKTNLSSTISQKVKDELIDVLARLNIDDTPLIRAESKVFLGSPKVDGFVHDEVEPPPSDTEDLIVSHRSKLMTTEEFISVIQSNLLHVQVVENGFLQMCDILALGGSFFLLPLHIFKNRRDMKVLLTKRDTKLAMSTERCTMSVERMVPILGKDLAIVSIETVEEYDDITYLFPIVCNLDGDAEMLYRTKYGSLRKDHIFTTLADSLSGGPGYDYTCAYDTFCGLCMAVIVGKFRFTTLAGFHLRGYPGHPDGKALILCQGELLVAIARLTAILNR